MRKLRYLSLYFHGYLNNNDHELHNEELWILTHYSIFNSLIMYENIINNNGFILFNIFNHLYY